MPIKCVGHFSDGYMEVDGSHCLRTQQLNGDDHLMAINYAKEECSRNDRCVGIEYVRSDPVNNVGIIKKYKICLDATYKSIDGPKYKGAANKLLKRVETSGKYNTVGILKKLKVLLFLISLQT